MKKLIIAIVALALLGGAGGGAYMFFMKPANASETKEETTAKKEEDSKAAEAAVTFVQMTPLVLPIVDKNGVSQVVNLVISLEVKDAEVAKEVERFQPRLKDAFIQDMYGVLTRQAAMDGGVVQVGYIKNRLNKVTTKVMGKDKVQDVLLQVVQQRPI